MVNMAAVRDTLTQIGLSVRALPMALSATPGVAWKLLGGNGRVEAAEIKAHDRGHLLPATSEVEKGRLRPSDCMPADLRVMLSQVDIAGSRADKLAMGIATWRAGRLAGLLENERAEVRKTVVGLLSAERAAKVLRKMETAAATETLGALEAEHANAAISHMSTRKAAELLSALPAATAAAILDESDPYYGGREYEILEEMDEDKAVEILSNMITAGAYLAQMVIESARKIRNFSAIRGETDSRDKITSGAAALMRIAIEDDGRVERETAVWGSRGHPRSAEDRARIRKELVRVAIPLKQTAGEILAEATRHIEGRKLDELGAGIRKARTLLTKLRV